MSDAGQKQPKKKRLGLGCGVEPRTGSAWQKIRRAFGLDPKRNQDGDQSLCKWFTQVSWKVGPIPPEMTRTDVTNTIRNALVSWSAECGFDVDDNPSSGNVDMIFGWYTDRRKPELFGVTAYAYLPCEDRPGDVYFNLDEFWDKDFLYKFAVHEIGHAIGLKNHSSNPSDVMQKSPEQTTGMLSDNDVRRSVSLYGRRNSFENDDAVA